jgi:hypothetical protein
LTRPGIAVDENDLYWADFGSIGRANLDGSNVNQNFIPVVAGPNMIGRATSAARTCCGARAARTGVAAAAARTASVAAKRQAARFAGGSRMLAPG